MSSISKLSDECEKCSHKNDCNNKRMMACALAEKKCNSMPNKAIGVINPFNNQISATASQITINITVESIKEQLEKQLRIDQGIRRCKE